MPSTLINAPESRQSVQNQEGLSRRARRELERDRSRPKILRPFARIARKVGSPTTVISRMALVGALAGITIVIPVQGGILPGDRSEERRVGKERRAGWRRSQVERHQ